MTPHQAKPVQSVLGPIAPEDLGICLIHEHVLVDLEGAYAGDQPWSTRLPFTIENLGAARRSFLRVEGAAIVDDPALLVDELRRFQRAGGGTVFDATSTGIRALPAADHVRSLQEIAAQSGVNIVLGCGHYVRASQTDDVAQLSEGDLLDHMLNELLDGVAGTEVRAGFIGEIGLTQPVDPFEWRALGAACEAHKMTGVPILVHPHYGVNASIAREVGEFIVSRGVDPRLVVLGHMDGHLHDEGTPWLLAEGFNWALDGFGLEAYYDHDDFNHNIHDAQREVEVLELCERGFESQVFLSQDVCTKMQLTRFGGFGYAHILEHNAASLEAKGFTRASLERLLVENPRRLFSRT